jgi:hypothetical protein
MLASPIKGEETEMLASPIKGEETEYHLPP